MTRVPLKTDVTNATTTSADVPGLTIPLMANVRTRFLAYIDFTTNAATTGAQFSVNAVNLAGAALTFSRLNFRTESPSSATAQNYNEGLNALDAYGTPPTTSPANLQGQARVEGFIIPSVDGFLVIRNKASTAVASANIVRAGSFIEYFYNF